MNPHETITRMFEDSLSLPDIYDVIQLIDHQTNVVLEHRITGGVSVDASTDLLASVNALYNAARELARVRQNNDNA